MGNRSPEGLLYLGRNVKFDPRPQRPSRSAEWAIPQIKGCFRRHVPAVVDTHRINYTGAWGSSAAQSLSVLLRSIQADRPLILTTVELGEAMLHGGRYNDSWSGEARHLTPLDSPAHKALRLGLHRYYATRTARIAP